MGRDDGFAGRSSGLVHTNRNTRIDEWASLWLQWFTFPLIGIATTHLV